ncbi:MAG: P-loop NTPase, partial [Desulfuromonadales bacterium]|nr:P-loop NTPase [Desulfuromonadales bacterium]
MEPLIIPVASGKGGVGKTMLTANLAIALARQGHRTIVADLDFGAANLHSFLQLSNDNPGIGDYLMARTAELSELLVTTPDPHLHLLPGDGQTPFMANLTYAHKVRLINALRQLDCRYLLLDLGAGSAFNTLDFFLISDHGLLVATPDLPSAMNLMVFTKNLVLRLISRAIKRDERLTAILKEVQTRPLRAPATTVEMMLARIDEHDSVIAEKIAARLARLTPRIVLNMGEHPDEIFMAEKIGSNLRQRLSVEIECLGFIGRDPQVRQSISDGQAFLPSYPDTLAARDIEQLCQRVVANRRWPLVDTIEALHREAQQWLPAARQQTDRKHKK